MIKTFFKRKAPNGNTNMIPLHLWSINTMSVGVKSAASSIQSSKRLNFKQSSSCMMYMLWHTFSICLRHVVASDNNKFCCFLFFSPLGAYTYLTSIFRKHPGIQARKGKSIDRCYHVGNTSPDIHTLLAALGYYIPHQNELISIFYYSENR